MLTAFIIMGFFCIPTMFMFLNKGDTLKEKICVILVILLFWLALSSAINMEAERNQENWNGGYCECGTHWELKGVSKSRYSETKYYACPNCYEEMEISY